MIEKLKFGKDGLIPAVVQDFYTKEVLTLAYMNRESLEISLKEGKTCFYSRSRQELWRKGATSGNIQHIVKITADCDRDALVVEVIKDGPACHTGENSCFNEEIFNNKETNAKFTLNGLYNLILERKFAMPEGSYTTYLFDKGIEKILKKVGEESAEVIIAAMKGSKEETVYEISDLVYHTLVLMAEAGISPVEILEELKGRHKS
ncbi:MAG: bifunctional phosphoribosyl-AMP cyclohydrolase/phosphoribosyl-ATP diphosphatase HisIE [Oscillospiraceae bacterium]|nr:bifunctional phosphoribosyl-AMP cyclohydrolase/phosphoribosyl-ATP diphosphatase HisIE [Oscillospiraceae bacterium]